MKQVAYILPQENIAEQIRIISDSLNMEDILDAVFDEKHQHYSIQNIGSSVILEITGFDEDSPFAPLNGIKVVGQKDVPESRYWEVLNESLMMFAKDSKHQNCLTNVSFHLKQALKEL